MTDPAAVPAVEDLQARYDRIETAYRQVVEAGQRVLHERNALALELTQLLDIMNRLKGHVSHGGRVLLHLTLSKYKVHRHPTGALTISKEVKAEVES